MSSTLLLVCCTIFPFCCVAMTNREIGRMWVWATQTDFFWLVSYADRCSRICTKNHKYLEKKPCKQRQYRITNERTKKDENKYGECRNDHVLVEIGVCTSSKTNALLVWNSKLLCQLDRTWPWWNTNSDTEWKEKVQKVHSTRELVYMVYHSIWSTSNCSQYHS